MTAPLDLDALELEWSKGQQPVLLLAHVPQLIARVRELESANALQGRTITQWADLIDRQGALLTEVERALESIGALKYADTIGFFPRQALEDTIFDDTEIARSALLRIRAAKGATG